MYVTGTILMNGKSMNIEGKVTDGVFTGSIMAPSATSIFGSITSVEMNISSDGRSINFRNVSDSAELKGLKGTRAIRQ